MSHAAPEERQVLVNLGNRFVVFGNEFGMPKPTLFDPQDSPILPRVNDEAEVLEARILETLQIFGMTRAISDPNTHANADVEFIDPDGSRILIDIKVRESDPKQRDLQLQVERLNREGDAPHREIWFFNTEKLKLTVVRRAGTEVRFDELVPLNVWERTADSTFERQRVVDEVNDWGRRIDLLYTDVRDWLSEERGTHCEQMRSVIMSDEMMQRFAVPDRELPVLDVLRDAEVIASFVPRGLWLIGAWGRIDVITKTGTSILVAIRREEQLEWWLTSPSDRRQQRPFDKAAVLETVIAQ